MFCLQWFSSEVKNESGYDFQAITMRPFFFDDVIWTRTISLYWSFYGACDVILCVAITDCALLTR